MNTNDPIAARALAASHPEASPSEVDWQASIIRDGDREVAAEARHGGRALTRSIAGKGGDIDWIKTLMAEDAAGTWRWHIDPAGGDGRASWQRIAHSATLGKDMTVTLPESAFDWPIYIAGMAPRYGAAAVFNVEEDARIERMIAVAPGWGIHESDEPGRTITVPPR